MTTKLTIELKDGVDAAIKRCNDVRNRRIVERVLIKNETDENDSGWSEEEYGAKPSYSPSARVAINDFDRLFEVLGRLGGLRQLFVDYYANPIPIKALLKLFQRGGECNKGALENIGFRHVNFVGDISDFQEFARVIREQSVCLTVCLASCSTPDLTTTGSLVDAFSAPLKLTELKLEEVDVPGDALGALCSLPTLATLSLRHIPSCNQHMESMAEALRHNQVLQSIQIRYALDKAAAHAFFHMLEINASIKTVDIDMNCWDMYGCHLGNAFRMNNTLQNVELNVFGNYENVEVNAASIAKAVGVNTTLRRLCLTFHIPLHQPGDDVATSEGEFERLSCAFSEPFAKVMPNNFALGVLLVGPVHRRVQFDDDVRYFLKLNHAGRRELLEPNEASRNEWVETLIGNQDDLDVLFYFLSMNPSLTDCNHGQSDRIVEPRYKRMKVE